MVVEKSPTAKISLAKRPKTVLQGAGTERFEAKFPALAELHTLKGIQEEGVTCYGGSLNLLHGQ